MTITAESVSFPQLTDYSFQGILYQGHRTTVYRAVETATQQSVVIKVLTQEYPNFAELVQFRNQYTVAKNLPISGIVHPLSLAPSGNGYALVMEDFGGIDLGQYVQQYALGFSEVLNIAIQLADILHQIHQHRVIHKDIKPANILIHPESKQVKLIDFSIASLLPKETQAIQSPGSLEGTLAYMAPEQTGRMNRAIDYRTDFYALGITIYQLLTGQLPFTKDDSLELIHCHMAQVPIAVDHINAAVPPMVAKIVAKLMAKNTEDRYQSALGLKYDLEQCLTQWKEQGDIVEFVLGKRDLCDRFFIPEKLYGREAEVQNLLDAFDRSAQGSSELMLVVGFSGIGKTAVVNEVHKPIVRQRGYFIKGKFDQFNRNIPFSAFVQAFRNLVGQLLSESDGELANWKANILTALGDSGQVLIDVIPELEHIIGKQPAVSELSGNAAQNRFNRLCQKFITVFTTPEHPLVIFLDDLQWADSASLPLLNLLMTDLGMGYLLVLGAYRDNEVSPTHPLMLTLEDIKKDQATISTLTLKPLVTEHIHRLVTDTLLCSTKVVAPLAELVYQKTQGNPFFTTQFLYGLHEENLITFNSAAGYWQCNLAQIQQLALTDDVIEFMVRRLQKLPTATQTILKLAACIGNHFDLETLAVVCDRPQYEVAIDLWPSLQGGLVTPENNTYKFFQGEYYTVDDTAHDIRVAYRFLHDRIQQAAYVLIAEEDKPSTHLKIGQLLLARHSSQKPQNNLFKIVNNLNKGIRLIDDDQRQQLASLSLEAGQQAKSSIAYVEALAYIEQAISLLSPQGWRTQYSLLLQLYSELAEIQFFRGEFEAVGTISDNVLEHIQQTADALPIYITKLSSDLAQGNMVAGFNLGLNVLSSLGLQILANMDEDKIQQRCHQTLTNFKTKTIQDYVTLSQNNDSQFLRTQDLLTVMVGYAYKFKPELLPSIIGEQVALLMRHGNIPASASIYALYGMLLCGSEDFESGFFAGEVALTMMEVFPTKQYEMRVRNLIYSYIMPWKGLLRDSLIPLKQGFTVGLEVGDIEYTSYGMNHYIQFLYFSGTDLATVDHEMVTYCNILKSYRQEGILSSVKIFHQAVLNFIYASNSPWQLEGEIFQESKYLIGWKKSRLEYFLCALYINKLVLSVSFNNSDLALKYAALAHNSYKGLTGEFQVSYLYCYRALAHLAVLTPLAPEKQAHGLAQVAIDLAKLEQFASHAPMNFQHQVELIKAERHRLLGQRLEAMDSYDQAITLAKAHGYIQEEALANEIAAKFYLDWDKERVAAGYMQEAYYCYSRWGAKAKVTDLEMRYPKLLHPILKASNSSRDVLNALVSVTTPTTLIHPSTHHDSSSSNLNQVLDFASIFKASQALSSTIQLEELLRQLTQIILQNSGSDRCALMLPDEHEKWQVRAIAIAEDTQLYADPLDNNPHVPVKLIQYVKNTQETILINDLETDLPVIDEYLRAHQPKSVLCLPLLNQGKLIGILYLNNYLTSGVFTKDRISVLNFLCSQAAISLENAQFYQQAHNREQAMQQQTLTLTQLSQSTAITQGPLSKAYEEITETVARLLQVERVSIWLLDPERSKICCVNLFEAQTQQHTSKHIELHQADYPAYFSAVLSEPILPIEDAWNDPRTCEFRYGYLDQFNIKSMLDSSFNLEGRTSGIICCEATTKRYSWSQSEQIFIRSISNLIALAIESNRKQENAQKLEIALLDLEQSQLQLVQQEKMASLGNLVAGVAHEVNNPIGFLNGSVDNAKDYIQDLFEYLKVYQQQQPPTKAVEQLAKDIDLDFLLEDFPKMLDSMHTAADRITDISTSLRAFSRADTTKKVSVNIHEGLDSTLLILKYRLKANEYRPAIEVIKHYGDVPEINCFPAQLNQVFMNILANAIDMFDAMSEQMSLDDLENSPQKLTIQTANVDGHMEIRISDNGTGMADEVKARVFDHLFTTKVAGKGTGLGLAIAHQIIVATHGGSLDVQSEVGQGTEFLIRLPS